MKNNQSQRRLSRQEVRDLDIEINFLEGLVRRDPGYIEALHILGDDYTKLGRFRQGLEIDKKVARSRPANPYAHYNLACSYSLTGQFDRAAVALLKAISLGYSDFQWLRRDPDLAPLRKQPLYAKIREKIRSLKIKAP